MERFVIIVNGWKPLTIITKRSILDVAAVPDPPLHISNIYKSAANQLNAILRLKVLLILETKKVLIYSYFFSNFNNCRFVWMFSTPISKNKHENLQKRALRCLYKDYELTYEQLLVKADKASKNASRLRECKSFENLKSFNTMIKNWNGIFCTCKKDIS